MSPIAPVAAPGAEVLTVLLPRAFVLAVITTFDVALPMNSAVVFITAFDTVLPTARRLTVASPTTVTFPVNFESVIPIVELPVGPTTVSMFG